MLERGNNPARKDAPFTLQDNREVTHSAVCRERASGHLGRAAGAGTGCARNPGWRGPVYVSAARGAGPPAGRRGRQGLGVVSRHAAREDPGLASGGPRSERRPETAPPSGRGRARPLRRTAASRGGGASGGSAFGRRLTQSGRVSRDTEAAPNRKRTKKITVRDAESKRTRSHHEQQRSISNTAYLPCATSWESSIPSDLTPSSGPTLHRRSAGVLRALSSKLCSSRGCHSSHHVSCVSWRLSVFAYGPVCGCWAFRLHYPHGLLSSRSHLSTWLSSAGRRRV